MQFPTGLEGQLQRETRSFRLELFFILDADPYNSP